MQLNNKIGLVGVIPCIALATVGCVSLINQPGMVLDNSLPIAALSRATAAQFTAPPTLNFAGSDRLYLGHILYTISFFICACMFAITFWLRTDPQRQRSERLNNILLVTQLTIVILGQLDLSYFIALEVAVLLPKHRARRWMMAIVVLCFMVRLPYLGHFGPLQYTNLANILTNMIVMTVMQLMAFGVGTLFAAERSSRLSLVAANTKLLATQQLLNDMSRTSERIRLSRDLHDTIGHHLTALNLHLDLASRRQPKPDESIMIARELAQSLMTEVRIVVSSEREHRNIDLRQSLQTLCNGIPTPEISLYVDESVFFDSPVAAHALFSVITEAITNTIKHAHATRVDIRVCKSGDELIATVSDNGIGKSTTAKGNGLLGIHERIGAINGIVTESTTVGGGFSLTIRLPIVSKN